MSRLARALDRAGEIASGAMEIGRDMLTVKGDEGYGVVTGKQRNWIEEAERAARREPSGRRAGRLGSGRRYVDPLLAQQGAWEKAQRSSGGRRSRAVSTEAAAPRLERAAEALQGGAGQHIEAAAEHVRSPASWIGSHIDEFGK